MNLTLSADFLRFFNYQFKASYYLVPETTKEFGEVGKLPEDFDMTDLTSLYQYKKTISKWEINNFLTFNWHNTAHSVTALVGQTAEGYKNSWQESNKKGAPDNDPNNSQARSFTFGIKFGI